MQQERIDFMRQKAQDAAKLLIHEARRQAHNFEARTIIYPLVTEFGMHDQLEFDPLIGDFTHFSLRAIDHDNHLKYRNSTDWDISINRMIRFPLEDPR